MNLEKRLAPMELPKLTEAGPKSPGIISGYALKFNTVYNLGFCDETISPNAFFGANLNDVRCLFNHDPSLILGRNKAGTLKLTLDGVGLFYRCELPDSPNGINIREAVRRKDVDQSSWSFFLKESGADDWEKKPGKKPLRIITGVDIVFDVSPVTFPANPAATAGWNDSLTARKSFEVWEAKKSGKPGVKLDFIGERLKMYHDQMMMDQLLYV
ncbi:MAG: HK97 family phage prohead protease [Saprospiraceae bacterium]|nr:HK97 family phage prohead protease [Saprospiraceae bacterium]